MSATLDTAERIHSRHPVREVFAARSTNGRTVGYYETKGHAINAFDGELQTFDLCFSRGDVINFVGNEGRVTLRIVNGLDHVVGFACLSWYRMPSGRYEFTGYIA